jgi:transcriptional regulator with XRE-family HTH domain
MCNIDRIKNLARQKGVKIKYICAQLGLAETYLSNVKNGKDRMTQDRLEQIADILGTTIEYLTDQTDDPSPKEKDPIQALDEVESAVVEILRGMTVQEKLDLIEYLKGKE